MEAGELGRTLWDFLRIGAPLQSSDAIVVFGGHDLRVAEWAAQLVLDGWAPWLVCSGGLGYYTREIWSEPEAHKFRRIAIGRGVPEEAIIVEDRSTNSGENVIFTRRLLAERGVRMRRAICVQKPYMERRVWATLRKQWVECDFVLSSPPISYGAYAQAGIIEADKLLKELVGQVDRIERYPTKGFTVPVDVPTDVARAKARLIELGFADHLVPA
jgi:uncharacterized SAM-binding protein YcdF (DUF218 family)